MCLCAWASFGSEVPVLQPFILASPVKRDESRIVLVLGQDTDSDLQMISGLQKG